MTQPAPDVTGAERALRAGGRPATLYRYDGTGHWFFEPDRRTLTFLEVP